MPKRRTRARVSPFQKYKLAIAAIVVVAAAAAVFLALGHGPQPQPDNQIQILEKGQSTGRVRVSNGQLIVNGQPFVIRGIGYDPIPIGRSYAYSFYGNPEIYSRDFPMIREMGCNVIRTWSKVTTTDFLDAAYNNGVNPIYVIMGFHVEPANISNPDYRSAVVNEFKEYVRRFKDHPAVLMWCVGNEVEYEIQKRWPDDDSKLRDWYTLLNDLARAAYEVEGDSYHPVMTSACEIYFIGDRETGSDDNSLKFLDVWGATIFRGRSFEGAFDQFRERSSKPLVVTEFGVDAWDSTREVEDESTQAEYAAQLLDELSSAGSRVLGGCYFEWSDEWWKAGSASSHDYGGFDMPSFPDGVSNEEWFGVCRVLENDGGPNIMQPRAVYQVIKEKYGG